MTEQSPEINTSQPNEDAENEAWDSFSSGPNDINKVADMEKAAGELGAIFDDNTVQELAFYYTENYLPEDEKTKTNYRKFMEIVSRNPSYMDVLNSVKISCEKAAHCLNNLRKNAPEILLGKLPDEQNTLLDSSRYVLGFNQSYTFDVEESQDYIIENKGIELGIYNPSGRFVVSCGAMHNLTERYASQGYYNDSENYRFVVAFPLDKYTGENIDDGRILVDRAYMSNELPEDFIIENGMSNTDGSKDKSVNGKYIAGVINEHGEYHENANFMNSSVPDLKSI